MGVFLVLFFSSAWAEGDPGFRYCKVFARNSPVGISTFIVTAVYDSNGSCPGTISEVTVEGPNDFICNIPEENDYEYISIPGLLAEGEYMFTVEDGEGKTATSCAYLKTDNIIPVPNFSTYRACGDPLAPTLSWSAVSGYEGNLSCRVSIQNTNGDMIWCSSFRTNPYVVVPSNVLAASTEYLWNVEAFDGKTYFDSYSRSYSQSIPLVINNTSPYMCYAFIYNRQEMDGFYTVIDVGVDDPNGILPESIASVVIECPDGSTYTLGQEDYDEEFQEFYYKVAGKPFSGIHTITVTDIEGLNCVTQKYVAVHDVPPVDAGTLKASGDPLAPVLSWSEPAGLDQQLYYRIIVEDADYDRVWFTGRFPETIKQIPEGILQPGVSYHWYVRACDDSDYMHLSNESRSESVPLVVNNAIPYFTYAVVSKMLINGGFVTELSLRIIDPNGAVPGSIEHATVTGPGDFVYEFQLSDYDPYWDEYYVRLPGKPQVGVYTFTVTDIEGNTEQTHNYMDNADDIPAFDESSLHVSGDPTAPIIGWSAISGYRDTLYYRVTIEDFLGNQIYQSRREPYSSCALPEGCIQEGKLYRFQLDAYDHDNFYEYKSRSRSGWIVSSLSEVCECDLNGDGSCNVFDWFSFIEDWGRTDCSSDCECDLNGDGSCNVFDWFLFIEDWGRTDCPVQ